MQLRHGDNVGKGFCTSTHAYIQHSTCAFTKIVFIEKLDRFYENFLIS